VAQRPSVGMPSMSRRAKRVLLTVVGLIVLGVLWFQFVGLYVDWAWFGEVGYREVFTTQLWTRVILFVIGAVVAGAVVMGSLLMAFRSRPVFVPGNEADPLAPYRSVVSGRPRIFSWVLSGIVALICGLSAQGEWQTVQLFLHQQKFGTVDPEFGHDVGFYVFSLPLWESILSWLLVFTTISFFVVLVVQYLFGGIRFSGQGRRISSQATLQLSLLIGFFVLVKAVRYWFDRYDLLFSNRGGSFTGASYTDLHAVLPAKIILMCIAAICAVGFVVGAFLRSIRLPAIALALLVLSSVLIGGIWPLVLQQVVVNPSAISREPPYITRNIAATQTAYGLGNDKVTYENYEQETSDLPANQLLTKVPSVNDARLLDPNVLSDTFTQQQQNQNFYGFADQLTLDRYTDKGVQQSYVVGAREINAAGLSADQTSWINEHLVYTHGNGLVAAPVNSVNDSGYPNYVNGGNTTDSGPIAVSEPRIYFGALAPSYAIVGSSSPDTHLEYDSPTTRYTYSGSGGVGVGNFIERLIFATHYGEANFLFSSEINGNSKIMYNRDPLQRVQEVAPFLTLDTHPYPAAVDGRIVWIVDGYTTASNYPYSQSVSLANATNNSLNASGQAAGQADTQVSYVRNSVKATVDAYNGTVTLYSVDSADPMLKAWEGVFPGLIHPQSDISTELQAHFRYPQDLFEIQRQLLAKYHVTNPVDFFNNSNFWKVPDDPTESGVTAAQPPYYQQLELPGQTSGTSTFQLTSALTGFQRQFLQAYMSASSDPATYGKITILQLSNQAQIFGPVQVQQALISNPTIAQYTTTRQSGAKLVYGNLLTIPTSAGLLYVEPLYLRGVSANASPQLNQVFVWFNNRVGSGNTLPDALVSAANSAPLPPPDDNGGGTSTSSTPPSTQSSSGQVTTTQQSLPADAQQALSAVESARNKLDEAKKSGDLAAIGAASADLEQAVDNYLRLALPSTTTPAPTGSTAQTSGG
jgi:uncharacterized protein